VSSAPSSAGISPAFPRTTWRWPTTSTRTVCTASGLADDRYPVPDEDGINCNYDVLVSVSAVSGFGDRHRIVIEHPVRLELEPGDLLYIRRPPRPDPDPDRHPIC